MAKNVRLDHCAERLWSLYPWSCSHLGWTKAEQPHLPWKFTDLGPLEFPFFLHAFMLLCMYVCTYMYFLNVQLGKISNLMIRLFTFSLFNGIYIWIFVMNIVFDNFYEQFVITFSPFFFFFRATTVFAPHCCQTSSLC